jgi:glycosyltransferase involved in cell wall biosynthesis
MTSISVVIPAFNAERFIAAAVTSVLQQSCQDIEVIVVNDGSTDNTAAAVPTGHPLVRCVSKVNGGASSARNLGVSLARGEFVAFLDADDAWHPDKLKAQLALLRAYPAAVLCRGVVSEAEVTAAIPLWPPTDSLPPHIVMDKLADSFLDPYFATSAVMVRRLAFVDVGGFDESLKIAEDVDLYLRLLAKRPQVPVLSLPAVFKRPVLGSLGDDSEAGYVQLIEVYRRFLHGHPDKARALGRAVVASAQANLWARYAGSLFRNGKRSEAWQAVWVSLKTRPTMLGFRVLLRVVRP